MRGSLPADWELGCVVVRGMVAGARWPFGLALHHRARSIANGAAIAAHQQQSNRPGSPRHRPPRLRFTSRIANSRPSNVLGRAIAMAAGMGRDRGHFWLAIFSSCSA